MAGSKEVFVGKDQYLFREGDPSDSMYLIQEGTLSVRKNKAGKQIEIGRVYANEVIGELSFFDRKPRSAAALATTPVVAMKIEFNSLDGVYKKIPPYLQTIMQAVAERLRKADETIKRLQTHTVEDPKSTANRDALADAPDPDGSGDDE